MVKEVSNRAVLVLAILVVLVVVSTTLLVAKEVSSLKAPSGQVVVERYNHVVKMGPPAASGVGLTIVKPEDRGGEGQ